MTATEQQTFTIDGLADETRRWLEEHRLDARYYRRVQEVPSERTIRYYRTQGLLDEPLKDGNKRLYARRHMLQLLAIKGLQTRGLSHERIQAELYARTDAELELIISEVLAAPSEPETPPMRELVEVTLGHSVRLVADPSIVSQLGADDRRLLVERLQATLDALSADKGRRARN